MLIQEACDLLKRELLNNGYKYGFYLDGKIYTPRLENGFDKDFFHRLLTDYRIQEPSDTMKAKVGTCNDIVALMRAMLNEHGVPSKVWLFHNKGSNGFHTVLTFQAEGKIIYLELTPSSTKPWYGKELIFDSEQSFILQYSQNGREVIDITASFTVGKAPEFILSRMV